MNNEDGFKLRLMDCTRTRRGANNLNDRFDELTTKHGLLYINGNEVDLPMADWIAHKFGFVYVERLVKYLEKRNG